MSWYLVFLNQWCAPFVACLLQYSMRLCLTTNFDSANFPSPPPPRTHLPRYILFDKTLQCSVMKQGDVHRDLFKGAGKKFKKVPWRDIARERQNAARSEEQVARIRKRLRAKDKKKRKRLAELGITYDFEGFVRSFVRSFVRLSVRSSVRSFVRLFVRSAYVRAFVALCPSGGGWCSVLYWLPHPPTPAHCI